VLSVLAQGLRPPTKQHVRTDETASPSVAPRPGGKTLLAEMRVAAPPQADRG
jgi:hypothetical protein